MFGYATSGCEALDAEMERAGGLFERDRAAPELDRLVGACLRRPAYKLATGRDYTMRRYVLAALSQMTSLAYSAPRRHGSAHLRSASKSRAKVARSSKRLWHAPRSIGQSSSGAQVKKWTKPLFMRISGERGPAGGS